MHSQQAIMNQITAIAAISDQIGYRRGSFLDIKNKEKTDTYMATLTRQYNEKFSALEQMINELCQTNGDNL